MATTRRDRNVPSADADAFLNVDLEIESRSRLDQIAEELGASVIVLYSGRGRPGRWLLCLESAQWPRHPNTVVARLCRALERLTARGRRLWAGASRRVFSVGYQLPPGERATHFTLDRATLERIVECGGELEVVCYRGQRRQAKPTKPRATGRRKGAP